MLHRERKRERGSLLKFWYILKGGYSKLEALSKPKSPLEYIAIFIHLLVCKKVKFHPNKDLRNLNFVVITYDSLISYPVSNKDLFFPCLYNRFLTNPFLLNNWNTLHCSLCYSLSVFSVNLISLVKRPQCKGNLVILIESLDLFEIYLYNVVLSRENKRH